MRMRKIVDNRTLKSEAAEFLAFKRAQKIRERTLHDYQKYINPFIEQSSNSMDAEIILPKMQRPGSTTEPGHLAFSEIESITGLQREL